MFKRRTRASVSTASDQPFCAMCGQTIRLDVTTGRCALGHRVAVAAPVVEPVAAEETADALDGYVDDRIAAFTSVPTYDPYGEPDGDHHSAWDTATEDTQPVGALTDFLSWDDTPAGEPSALDFDTAELPVATTSDLLDELGGDAPAYARRSA